MLFMEHNQLLSLFKNFFFSTIKLLILNTFFMSTRCYFCQILHSKAHFSNDNIS